MYQSTEACPHCGTQNLRGTWVCPRCGNTLLAYCPNCSAGNTVGSQYCHACGSPLMPTTQVPPTQPVGQQQPTQYATPDYQAQPQQPYTSSGYGAPGDPQAYQGYQQYPGYGAYPPPSQPYQGIVSRLKQIVLSTNPFLLSALVMLVVGLTVFLVLAFQFNWIKTAQPVKQTTVTSKTPPMISNLQVEGGSSQYTAIISWITDKYSSSQVAYGLWPVANTLTPVQNDPTTGTNTGVLQHQVGLTNLIPKSSYSYQAISVDKDGNVAKSPMMQFDTSAQ